MARLTAYILVFSLGAAAALALVSCGGSDDSGLLPGTTASDIVANLDTVKKLNAEGSCTEAEAAADEVRLQVADLDTNVDPKLRQALLDGAERLQAVTANCVEQTVVPLPDTVVAPTGEAPTDETTTKETTKTAPTEPTTSTTTPTTTQTTTPTTPTTPTVPPTTPSGDGSGGVGPGARAKGGT